VRLAGECAVVVVDEEEAAAVAATPPDRLVVTLGARGAGWCDREVTGSCPAFAVASVGAVGAGDTFAAALAVALAEGPDLAGSVRHARRAAAGAAGGAIRAQRRTDAYLMAGDRDPEEVLADAIGRGRAFLDAGVACVFVPGKLDVETVGRLVEGIGECRVSVIGVPGSLPQAKLASLGVARVSFGPWTRRVALTALADVGQNFSPVRCPPVSERLDHEIGIAEAVDGCLECAAPRGGHPTRARRRTRPSLVCATLLVKSPRYSLIADPSPSLSRAWRPGETPGRARSPGLRTR